MKPQCTDYRTGKYRLTDTKNDLEYLIVRNDSTQLEKNVKTGEVTTFKVNWINDCQYSLSILEGNEDIMNFYEGKTLDVKIVNIFKDGYQFEATMEGKDMLVTHILKKEP